MKPKDSTIHYADIAAQIEANRKATPAIPGYEDPNSFQGKAVRRFVEGAVKKHFPQALDLRLVFLTGDPGTHGGMDPEMQIMLHTPLDAAPDAAALEAFKKDLEPLKCTYKGKKVGSGPWGQVTPQPVWGFDQKIDDAARVFVTMPLSLAELYRNLHDSQKEQGKGKW